MSLDLETEWRRLLKNNEQRLILKGLVPSQVGLNDVSLQRLGGAGNSQKIVFSNLDRALEEPSNQNVSALKQGLLAWCQRFGECRMSQGNDLGTFEIIVTQRVAETKIPAQSPINPTYEPLTTVKASIISRAVIGKK